MHEPDTTLHGDLEAILRVGNEDPVFRLAGQAHLEEVAGESELQQRAHREAGHEKRVGVPIECERRAVRGAAQKADACTERQRARLVVQGLDRAHRCSQGQRGDETSQHPQSVSLPPHGLSLDIVRTNDYILIRSMASRDTMIEIGRPITSGAEYP